MYSVILSLILAGGLPPVSKADFSIVGDGPTPIVQALNKNDFNIFDNPVIPVVPKPTPEPVVPAPVVPIVPKVQYVVRPQAQVYGSVYGGSSCASGRCPSSGYGYRYSRR